MQNILPRSALLTIYKSFIRPHLDYGDIIYEQAYNVSFINASKTTTATVQYLSRNNKLSSNCSFSCYSSFLSVSHAFCFLDNSI